MEEKINYDLRSYSKEAQSAFATQHQFISNEDLYNRLITMTSICPKLVLAGSVSLHALDLVKLDFKTRSADLDFALTEPLTEEEFDIMKSLFELEVVCDVYADNEIISVDNMAKIPTKDILKKDLIRLWDQKLKIHIDIFNSQYDNNFDSKQENLYPLNFRSYDDPHIIYVQHPSKTISYKVRYAFYESYRKNKKHKSDCIDFLCKDHDKILKRLQSLSGIKRRFHQALSVKTAKLEDLRYITNELTLSAE
jgi:hypothetical protein